MSGSEAISGAPIWFQIPYSRFLSITYGEYNNAAKEGDKYVEVPATMNHYTNVVGPVMVRAVQGVYNGTETVNELLMKFGIGTVGGWNGSFGTVLTVDQTRKCFSDERYETVLYSVCGETLGPNENVIISECRWKNEKS